MPCLINKVKYQELGEKNMLIGARRYDSDLLIIVCEKHGSPVTPYRLSMKECSNPSGSGF